MEISLSRLSITGPVSPDTPKIVIQEIADTHFIKYDENKLYDSKYLVKLLSLINTKKVMTVRKPYTKNTLKIIARYVNPKCMSWRKESLEKAFIFLTECTTDDQLLKIYRIEHYGPQTPDKPESLNACILYKLCRMYNIITNFDTTIHQMVNNIKLLYQLKYPNVNHSIRTDIIDFIMYENCNNSQLINILSLINVENECYSGKSSEDFNNSMTYNIQYYSYEELENTAESIKNTMVKKCPINPVEAVVMAAIYYKLDISQVDDPIKEYKEITRTPYIPHDRKLAYKIRESRKHKESLLNPYLTENFNPNFPYNMYDEDDLIQLCKNEGYVIYNFSPDSSYTKLQTAHLSDFFIHGKQGNIKNEETTFFETIEELEYDEVVTYGVRNETVKAYTYGELADTFKSYIQFKDPIEGEIFSEESIDKLFLMSQMDQRITETTEMFEERLNLGREIERVKLYNQIGDKSIRDFQSRYNILNDTNKSHVESVLTKLLHSALYMRGWTGEGPYPLKSEDTNFEMEEQINVDHRVTQSLIELETSFDQLNENIYDMGNIIRDLPLMEYNRYSNSFNCTNLIEEGLTIKERLRIVRGGEDASAQSCIRLSSNKLTATAYYYMFLIGMELSFEISEVSYIS